MLCAMPLMLPQAVRGIEEGHTLLFSHLAGEKPVKAYLPFPPELAR